MRSLIPVKVPDVDYVEQYSKKKTLFEVIDSMEGDSLPVSSFVGMPDGTYEAATSKYDKRDVSDIAPCYISENCIGCKALR